MSLAPGDQIGPYEIIAPLGQGGMDEVYRVVIAPAGNLDPSLFTVVVNWTVGLNQELKQRARVH